MEDSSSSSDANVRKMRTRLRTVWTRGHSQMTSAKFCPDCRQLCMHFTHVCVQGKQKRVYVVPNITSLPLVSLLISFMNAPNGVVCQGQNDHHLKLYPCKFQSSSIYPGGKLSVHALTRIPNCPCYARQFGGLIHIPALITTEKNRGCQIFS